MSSRTCRPAFFALVLTLAVGCIPALAEPLRDSPREAAEMWNEAHRALHLGQLQAAEERFVELTDAHPETDHGREALFFAGLVRLDPDHPDWSAEVAAARLARYLGDAEDENEDDGEDAAVAGEADHVSRHRTPEARTALALARQFQLPADQRIQPLRPVVRTVPAEAPPIPADATPAQLRAEIQRLVGQVAERDETIRRQREELERIRRTLIPDDG